MEMKKSIIDTAPSPYAKKEIMRTYYELGRVANKVCDFLRKRGYSAQAGPALGGDVNYPKLAENAGLGAIGKHGLLIHPKYGPSLRIGAVYTSIDNLPSTEENEHLWLRSFCSTCKRCVKKNVQQVLSITKILSMMVVIEQQSIIDYVLNLLLNNMAVPYVLKTASSSKEITIN